MTGDVDVLRVPAVWTETDREMRLDDSRGTPAHKRRSVHRDAVDGVDPRTDRVKVIVTGVAQISGAAIHDFIDNLLHPRRPAAHLRRDKDVDRLRLIRPRARKDFRA